MGYHPARVRKGSWNNRLVEKFKVGMFEMKSKKLESSSRSWRVKLDDLRKGMVLTAPGLLLIMNFDLQYFYLMTSHT